MPRKKIPKPLKIIKGTFRADRDNPDAPEYDIETPDMPKHLSAEAGSEWDRLAKIFCAQGLLSKVDMACLASYCQLYGRWVQAETELNGSSLVIETESGNIIQNPLLGVANTALKLMNKCLLEFGMTPASRSRVSVKKKEARQDPWAFADRAEK